MEDETDQRVEHDLAYRLVQRGAPYALSLGRNHRGHECLCFAYGPKTLLDLIGHAAKKGVRPYIVTGNEELSFADISERARGLATTLILRHHIRIGDRVGLHIRNSPEWVVAFFAIQLVGAVSVLIPHGSELELEACLILTDCSHVISEELFCVVSRDGMQVHFISPSDLIDGVEEEFLGAESITPDHDSLIVFTSGSTGKPKAALSDHRGVLTGIMNMMLSAAIANAGVARNARSSATPSCPLVLAPLSHVSGYGQVLLAAMAGNKVAISGEDDPSHIAELAQRIAATSLIGLTENAANTILSDHCLVNKIGTLRTWNVTGASLRHQLAARVRQLLPSVVISSSYGLTETNGGIASIAGTQFFDRPGSTGRVVHTAELKITDDSGQVIEPGKIGHIWVRGAMLMKGYLSEDGSVTAPTDGWFNTGDVGFQSVWSELVLLGRWDNIIWNNCGHISLTKLEELAIEYPGVEEVCCIKPTLGSARGEIACLVVENKQGIKQEFLKSWLLSKVLGEASIDIYIVKELARRSTGKVDRAHARMTLDIMKGGGDRAVER